MAATPKSDKPPSVAEADKLAQSLIGRGLVTSEEVKQYGEETDPKALLKRLVEAGHLTAAQARRAARELSAKLNQPIPGYELQEKLGQGAMGIVYKARQLSLNRVVAVKVLHARFAANPDFLDRLTREAHLAAKLSHNNIVQAIDVGAAGSFRYFVMEYVEGVTIKDELEAGKVYVEKEAVEMVLQVAQALQHARRRGLVHRDIKPANIILTLEGIAKLADLGMAREAGNQAQALAEKGMTIGTPYYIAPEQIHGREDPDCRADIYSLGATLYHMVTGQPPFPGTKVDPVLQAHLKEELTPPDHLNTSLSSGLGEVVEFMMAKKREQRYQTPDDLIIDLECLLSGEPPKLARQRIEASSLEKLAEGAADDEGDEAPPGRTALRGVAPVWVAVLGALLGLSALLNFVLLLRR